MNKIILAGGSGYVGSALADALRKDGLTVEVWDADIYPSEHKADRVVDLRYEPPPNDGSLVIWLASIHEMSLMSAADWHAYAQAICIDRPVAWANKHPMIYFSSARAFFADPKSLYSNTKRRAEERLLELRLPPEKSVLILRPGTIFGHGAAGAPQRLHTVPNAYLRGQPVPDGWCGAVTPLSHVVNLVSAWVRDWVRGSQMGNQIFNIFAARRTKDLLETFLDSAVSHKEVEALRALPLGEHPTELLRKHFNLSEPVFNANP